MSPRKHPIERLAEETLRSERLKLKGDILSELDHLLREIRHILVLILRLFRGPATIVFTPLDSTGEPMTVPPTPTEVSISITGTDSSVVGVSVGDASGTIIPGDSFDPGATITVADGTVCAAALSADQTTITVTGLNVDGSTTIEMQANVNGVALTDFGGPLVVNTTASASSAATVVFTPQA